MTRPLLNSTSKYPAEFMAAVDDLMKALDGSGVGDREKAEALYIFYTLRPEVVGV